jgi:MFS family permease
VVCFASIGWWSAFADRRGRKPVLFISLLGTVLLCVFVSSWAFFTDFWSASDLILVAVARTSFRNDGVSIGLIVEGLLGGFPTFIGVVHACALCLRLGVHLIGFCLLDMHPTCRPVRSRGAYYFDLCYRALIFWKNDNFRWNSGNIIRIFPSRRIRELPYVSTPDFAGF